MTAPDIKALAKQRGATVPELLVLAPANDPFYSGVQPASRFAAEWFRDVWQRHALGAGVHLRRIHYVLLSNGAALPDGSPYVNTTDCSTALENASKSARDLGLVDPRLFVDRKHPAPHLFDGGPIPPDERRAVVALEDYFDAWELPAISFGYGFGLPMPTTDVEGYDFTPAYQPFHVELWIEKSTMNDVLLPLCEELHVNLVTGVGFQSGTNIVRLVERLIETGKPTRVFYVSDFDPAGAAMPVATARRIEFEVGRFVPGADIKLETLALTADQVRRLRLPRIPIKATDKRRAGFEDMNGEGAVELDALEALNPGELERIVREAVAPYRDESLEDEFEDAARRAGIAAADEWRAITAPLRAEAEEIQEEVGAILDRHRPRVEAIAAELREELAPFEERIAALREKVVAVAEDFRPNLPGLPEADAPGADESDWLYSSDRDYFEQLAVYKARQGRPVREAA